MSTLDRIRRATPADLPKISELMVRACNTDHLPRVSALLSRGEMLVLATAPETVSAAACLTTANGRGQLAFLVVDPARPDMSELEERMRAVAAALCEAECCRPAFSHAS